MISFIGEEISLAGIESPPFSCMLTYFLRLLTAPAVSAKRYPVPTIPGKFLM